MKELVFINNDRVVTDSITLANEFDKRHDHVMRDIETQIEKLAEAGESEFSVLNFGDSVYINERGRSYKKYLLTEDAFALIAMSYVTPKAMKKKITFLNEFRDLKQKIEKNKVKVLDEKQSLIQSMKLTIETSERQDRTEEKLTELETKVEEQITLDYHEQRMVQKAIGKRVHHFTEEQDMKRKYYSQLHRDIKDRFAVASYKDIKRKDLLPATNYINHWIPKRVA
ncbi:Rha family transcriptional regulator [Geomicrobium sediminis]|uniref:Rha family phage regulatory protein n=1 Tax=Geomicrobium sediminis TaxID=1347788 RepID=A0ABS2PF96_9BACL|nr:Rha family transcriptional regulator [Geomicrobium sediminis]MBM7634031.1 Rha family phage regulatory protein [Geomicrobium sediminis]